MSGSFILTLDTTGPDIEITAPSYTTSTAKTDIWVYGSEALSSYQDFYFIDADGNRREVVFEYLGDRFHGVVYFTDFPIGIATFYGQVKDEVLNFSPVKSVSINISEQEYFYLEVAHYSRNVEISTQHQIMDTYLTAADIRTREEKRMIELKDMNRKVEVKVRNE